MDAPVAAPAFLGEGKEPLYSAYGFTLGGVLFKLYLGYALYEEGVLLYCTEKYSSQQREVWRRHWTSFDAALEAAESLAADAEEYFESLGIVARPVEDLDFDDFLFHLESRLTNAFH